MIVEPSQRYLVSGIGERHYHGAGRRGSDYRGLAGAAVQGGSSAALPLRPPNKATLTMFSWYRNDPWKRTEVARDTIVHNWPAPHGDFLTQTIDYQRAAPPTTRVIFPIDAVMSVVAETGNREQVEAGTIGNEGVVGIAPFLGAESSVLRTMCQIPGTALLGDAAALLAKADGAVATAVRRYAFSFMTMAAQGAACNRLHTVEQRGARWLLMINDRHPRNPFQLTQEFFAIMLGTTRPTVSLAATTLRKAGLIEYTRGQTELDVPRGHCARSYRDAIARLGPPPAVTALMV